MPRPPPACDAAITLAASAAERDYLRRKWRSRARSAAKTAASAPEPLPRGPPSYPTWSSTVRTYGGNGQNSTAFLPPFALAVTTEIKPQRKNAGFGQSGGKASEKASLMTSNTTAMNQHSGIRR
jgi:hypothetical protein